MANHKLTMPKLRVLVDDSPTGELTEYTVQTDNRDAVRFDVMRPRKSWPGSQEAPMLWMTILAWSAIKRSGGTADTVEDYLDKIVQIEPIDEDGNTVDPTTEDGAEAWSAGPLA